MLVDHKIASVDRRMNFNAHDRMNYFAAIHIKAFEDAVNCIESLEDAETNLAVSTHIDGPI